jgi:hypothetical protein
VTDFDAGDAPDPGDAPDAGATEPARTCPWCAAPAAADATRCTACGAALAQRESLGGVQIPGLTSVDPALEDFDKRPLHIPGPSPTHGFAPTLAVGMVAGGPVGVLAFGGVAALAGAELLASTRDRAATQSLEDLGQPSEVALRALEHVQAGEEAGEQAGPESGAPKEAADVAAGDDGQSIWRDLPPGA